MTPLTRRRFLLLCAVGTSGLALSVACGQQAPSAPAKPAESKPAEPAKPAAAAPTAVPTIAAPVVPQAQATAAPAAAPTQAPAVAAKPAAAAGPSGQVNVIQQLPITTLNANMEQSLANLNPSIHMADPLVFREPNGSVKPHLATAWSYPDDKTLRFKVRKDVKFHTGDVMTTEDVAFTYNLLLDPKTDSRHTPTLAAIVGTAAGAAGFGG